MGSEMCIRDRKDTGVIYRAFEKYLENRYVTAEDVLEVLAGKLEESALIKNSLCSS